MWPREQYLNIYVSPTIDFSIGYSPVPLPNMLPERFNDAVRLTASAFGDPLYNPNIIEDDPYRLGRVAIHEVGHWLGLNHLWGPQPVQGCSVDDGLEDTPLQDEPNRGCPTHPSPSCGNNGDMFMNFMDYSDNSCSVMFSVDQVEYMEFILEETRTSLIDAGCTKCLDDSHPKVLIKFKEDLICHEANDGRIEVQGYNGVPPYQFSLNDGPVQSSAVFGNLESGEYIIEIIDAQGKSSKRPFNIYSPEPITSTLEVVDSNCENGGTASVALEVCGGNIGELEILLFNETNSYSLGTPGFYEDFENGLPMNWSFHPSWKYGTSETLSGGGFDIPSSNNFIAVNDGIDMNTSGASSAFSNLINLNGSNNFKIIFDAYFIDGDFFTNETGKLYISKNQGTSYEEIYSLPRSTEWTTYELNIEDYDAPNVVLRFEYDDGFGWNYGLAIDNIKLLIPKYKIDLENIPAGQYTLDIQDELGCTLTQSFTIEGSSIIEIENLEITQPDCVTNGTINIQANSMSGITSYSLAGMSNSDGLFENLPSGIYEISITNNDGCVIVEEVELFAEELDISLIETNCSSYPDYSYDITVCEETGALVTWSLQYDGAIISSISKPSNCISFSLSPDLLDTGSEDYVYVLANSEDGCTNFIDVPFSSPSILESNAMDTVYLCKESEVFNLQFENTNDFNSIAVIDGNGQEYFPSADSIYVLNTAENYMINAIDNNSCTFEFTMTILENSPISVEVINQTSADSNTSGSIELSASGGVGPYTYNLGDETNTTGVWPQLGQGTYQILVIDAVGCTTVYEITIDFVSSISFSEPTSWIKIYPNPTHDILQVASSYDVEYSDISIFNTSMEQVFGVNFLQSDQILDMSLVPSGVYFIRINNLKINQFTKIVKL